jgi:hypothetical protein
MHYKIPPYHALIGQPRFITTPQQTARMPFKDAWKLPAFLHHAID